MRLYKNIMVGLTAALAMLSTAFLPVAATAADVFGPVLNYIPNMHLVAVEAATAGQTFATTSYADLAGTSVSIPATKSDYSKRYFRVCFSADVTKATATTGTIAVFANGAVIAASARTTSSAAAQNTMSGCYTVARASAGASTIKLQAKSGDTNTFTVANAQVEVWQISAL